MELAKSLNMEKILSYIINSYKKRKILKKLKSGGMRKNG
jgi:hypothetical protein